MKLNFAVLLTVIAFHATTTFAASSREMPIGISDAYVPRVQANSEAFVVVNGVFQNGCYRWSRAEVKEVGDHRLEIRSFATVQSGMCIMVLVPFTKEVKLGNLAAGVHTLRFLNGDGTYLEKEMTVE